MKKIYIALENVRSLHNVGSIMRTCSFFGFYKLILIGYSGTKLNFKGNKVLHSQLEKTSLGAEEDMEVTFLENAEELFHFAKENKLTITSIEQHEESTKLKNWNPKDNTILIFGNEVKGVSKDTLDISDEIVEIERAGNKASLNVTIAVGVVLGVLAA
jgi:tRNA G18 (ribose-2'-O)-methylase SpoU